MMDEIQRTIISRALLEEHGYDSNNVSDERLDEMADEILEYIGVSEHFSQALAYVMTK